MKLRSLSRMLPVFIALVFLAEFATAQPDFAYGIGGASGQDRANAVATDASGNIYVTGQFGGEVDFDPSDGADADDTFDTGSNLTDHAFVASYTSDGNFRWAFAIGGVNAAAGTGIATDGTNVYVIGRHLGQIDLDPGEGTDTETSAGATDFFVAAYAAADGAYVWGHSIGGTGDDVGNAIATDGTNVYITGYFNDTVDLAPEAGEDSETSVDGSDIFVAAYTASSGTHLWAHQIGDLGNDSGNAVAVVGTSVFVTGDVYGIADFDPDDDYVPATSFGEDDLFIAAYTAAAGDYIWSQIIGGLDNDRGYGIATDGTNVFVTGHFFSSAVDFDPEAGEDIETNNGSADLFIAAYTALAGDYVWAHAFGAAGFNEGLAIAVNEASVVFTGRFDGTVDFDPSGGIAERTSTSGDAAFVAQYAAGTGAFEAAGVLDGEFSETGRGIAAGSTVVVGSFTATIDLDPTDGTAERTSAGGNDIFIARFPNTAALPVELTAFTATRDGAAVVLAWQTASETNNAGFEIEAATGRADAWTTMAFIEGHGTTTEANEYHYRIAELEPGRYLFRLKQVDYDGAYAYSETVEVAVEVAETFALSQAFPNPFHSRVLFTLAVSVPQHVTVEVFDLLGHRVAVLHDGRLEAHQPHHLVFEADALASGVYVIRARGEQFTASRRAWLVR